MNIKLYSITKGEIPEFAACKKMISDCANVFSDREEKFKNFSSVKRLFLDVAYSLRSADCVIIAAQEWAYPAVKKALCRITDLTLEKKAEIAASVKDEEQALFPSGSAVFASDDLQFCGYALTSGPQHIIVLPIDPVRTADTVFSHVYDFLAEAAQVDEKHLPAIKKAAGICACARAASVLKKIKSSFVFVPICCSELFEKAASMTDKSNEVFFTAQEPSQKSPTQGIESYLTECIRAESYYNRQVFCAAVSPVFTQTSDNSLYAYTVFSDGNDITLKKIYSAEGESREMFQISAFNDLMISLCRAAVKTELKYKRRKPSKPDNRLISTLRIISAASIGFSAAVCAILVYLLGE